MQAHSGFQQFGESAHLGVHGHMGEVSSAVSSSVVVQPNKFRRSFMQCKTSALLFVALGAALIAAPSPSHVGGDSLYDQAFAEKGGNGKGGGGGNSGNGENHSAGRNGGATDSTTNFAAAQTGKQNQLALTDPSHPSMLGRWNSAKPLEHPAVQAHIRNGNFNGTMGMIAAYVSAQARYNTVQEQLTTVQTTLSTTDLATLQSDLATALTGTPYDTVEAYDAAVKLDSSLTDPEVEAAKQAIADFEAAEALVAAHELALDDLETAEANMAAYSNRGTWDQIRGAVREKLDLDPTEDDLAASEPPTATTQQ
jgi:hypothetical protein